MSDLIGRAGEVADAFRSAVKRRHVRIVSHFDSDGICASAILIKAFIRAGIRYSVTVVQNLTEKTLKELEREDHAIYVFADLGSGSISRMEKSKKTFFVLDHHVIEKEPRSDNIYLLNPHSFGIDGSKEISGAGVAFLFAEALDEANSDLAYLAVIGAIGDIQEEFGELNSMLLEKALAHRKMETIRELKIFGRETKPLHKVLEHSHDPHIPGVSGDIAGALAMLKKLGIPVKNGNRWKLLSELSLQEKRVLEAEVLRLRKKHKLTDDPFGTSYVLTGERKGSPFRDAREFSTLLNACGRQGKASLGIGACLGDELMKAKSVAVLRSYKQEMTRIMGWFQENDSGIIRGNGYVIINAEEDIPSGMIGTMASIISMGGFYPDGTYILSMARVITSDMTKASIRVAGRPENAGLNKLMNDIAGRVGGESGGHDNAAGAVFGSSREKEFIDHAISILGNAAMMEKVD